MVILRRIMRGSYRVEAIYKAPAHSEAASITPQLLYTETLEETSKVKQMPGSPSTLSVQLGVHSSQENTWEMQMPSIHSNPMIPTAPSTSWSWHLSSSDTLIQRDLPGPRGRLSSRRSRVNPHVSTVILRRPGAQVENK